MDNARRLAALGQDAANRVQEGMLVGLGTGSTAAAMVEALGQRVNEGLTVTGVATSVATADQARGFGIPLKELADIDRIDLCIDGADEIDPGLNLVKGRGGALLFEKLVARRADTYMIISTDEKLVEQLGSRMALPVEVIPIGWNHTAEAIIELGLRPTLRKGKDDSPFVTDGGHFILDCGWPGQDQVDSGALAQALKLTTGVVDHGLFIDMATIALTINPDGQITEHTA